MFRNADAAARILRGWHRRNDGGAADQVLRVALITDVDKDHRAYYRVGIAPTDAGPVTDAAETLMITAATALGSLAVTLLAFRVVFNHQHQLRVDRLRKADTGGWWKPGARVHAAQSAAKPDR